MTLKSVTLSLALLATILASGSSYAVESAFPDKVMLFKQLLSNQDLRLQDGQRVSDALAIELAEHQNGDRVTFKAVCQEAFEKSGNSYAAPCKYEIFRTWKRGNRTQVTYSVTVGSPSADGSNQAPISVIRTEVSL